MNKRNNFCSYINEPNIVAIMPSGKEREIMKADNGWVLIEKNRRSQGSSGGSVP